MDFKFIISFLNDLSKNNNREWFNKNKSRYLEVKNQFGEFVNSLIPEIAKFDDDVKYHTAKDCIFRIYNDTRFYKNKPPYKTNMGAFIAKRGKNSGNAGYYFHDRTTPLFPWRRYIHATFRPAETYTAGNILQYG